MFAHYLIQTMGKKICIELGVAVVLYSTQHIIVMEVVNWIESFFCCFPFFFHFHAVNRIYFFSFLKGKHQQALWHCWFCVVLRTLKGHLIYICIESYSLKMFFDTLVPYTIKSIENDFAFSELIKSIAYRLQTSFPFLENVLWIALDYCLFFCYVPQPTLIQANIYLLKRVRLYQIQFLSTLFFCILFLHYFSLQLIFDGEKKPNEKPVDLIFHLIYIDEINSSNEKKKKKQSKERKRKVWCLHCKWKPWQSIHINCETIVKRKWLDTNAFYTIS